MQDFSAIKTSVLTVFSIAALFLAIPQTMAAVGDPQFPFIVAADQGAGCFLAGDQITITEIRGTSQQLESGNTYQISGKYRLLSHPQASLTVYVVAANGNAPISGDRQSINVDRGNGQFTLVLPHINDDQPQLSFTTVDSGGERFGNLCLIAEKFPYAVEFKNELARFAAGDNIAISEIRSSSSVVKPGDMLQIKGMYTLASLWRARITANGFQDLQQNRLEPNHSVEADQGRGQFSVVLRVGGMGKLQLAFCPIGGQSEPAGSLAVGLGKARLGALAQPTFLSLLDSPDRPTLNFNFGANVSIDGNGYVQVPVLPPVPNMPYVVPFELGKSYFGPGDNITISQVFGTEKTIMVGGWYRITGTYSLASGSQAYLSAVVTDDKYSKNIDGTLIPQQMMLVNRGTGNYTLILPVRYAGWPHLAFYPAGIGGGDFGTQYFGTGDTVMREWNPDNPPEDIAVMSSISVTQRTNQAFQPNGMRSPIGPQ